MQNIDSVSFNVFLFIVKKIPNLNSEGMRKIEQNCTLVMLLADVSSF